MADEEIVETTEIQVAQQSGIVRVAGDVTAAFEEYKKLQQALDQAMPECLMTIQTKSGERTFRKKDYYRALGVAFNLSTEVDLPQRLLGVGVEDDHLSVHARGDDIAGAPEKLAQAGGIR